MSGQTTSLDRYDIPSPRSRSSTAANTSQTRSATVVSSHSSARNVRSSNGTGSGAGQPTEATLTVLIWHPTVHIPSSSALAKTPLLRDVPQVKRKLTRKDRDSIMGAAASASPFLDGASTMSASSSSTAGILHTPGASLDSASKSFASLKGATPSWLREKPSKQKLATAAAGMAPYQKQNGTWRRATITCRDSGALIILGEDHAMLHSISATELSASDIRRADDSLFGRPNVLGIFAKPSTLMPGARSSVLGGVGGMSVRNSTSASALIAPSNSSSSALSLSGTASTSPKGSATSKEEPIYMCFPTSRKMFRWRALLRTFARPEIYGPLSAGTKSTGTHRLYRQIDMAVNEIKIFAERLQNAHGQQERQRGRATGNVPVAGSSGGGGVGVEANTTADTTADEIMSVAAQSQSGDGSTINGGVGGRSSLDGTARTLASVAERVSKALALTHDGGNSDAPSSGQEDVALISAVADDSKSSVSGDDGSIRMSGPIIAGVSNAPANATAARQYENVSFVLPQSSSDNDRRRGSDGSLQHLNQPQQPQVQQSSCFCQIWLNGEIVARSKVGTGTSSIALFDRFSLQDLPYFASLHIEVLQSWRPGKYVQLGMIEIPVQTMRRSETLEGWYPIWAAARFEEAWIRRDEHAASYTREMVGELKLSIIVHDETVMALKRYAEVDSMLNGPGCVDLIRRMCKELQEDVVISHLVDVYTSGDTIVDRLSDLTKAESSSFSAEATLLFRSNSILSRSVDKYQRRYCIDWLEACIGPTVRRVCAERIRVEPPEPTPIMMGTSGQTTSTGGASTNSSTSTGSSSSDDSNIETLRMLSRELWNAIYANRHKTPPHLRSTLASIRRTVNERFDGSKATGVQSVGSFVFLRLICPAITSPNLYGLLGAAPDAHSSKTLMYLAKVFLSLANKRTAFDKDKEPWLQRLNDFLRQHAAAYDDFITIASTEADDLSGREAMGDDNDFAFQKAVQERLNGLPTLHRESIPRPGLRTDHALAMASLVSYVVRNASIEPYEELPVTNSVASGADDAALLNDFVDTCCDVEDLMGYHVDRAGNYPVPLVMYAHESLSGVYRTTSISTAAASARKGSPTSSRMSPSNSAAEGLAGGLPRSESQRSSRLRRATVSEGQGADAIMSSSATSIGSTSSPKPKLSYIGPESSSHTRSPHGLANVSESANSVADDEELPDIDVTSDSTNGRREAMQSQRSAFPAPSSLLAVDRTPVLRSNSALNSPVSGLLTRSALRRVSTEAQRRRLSADNVDRRAPPDERCSGTADSDLYATFDSTKTGGGGGSSLQTPSVDAAATKKKRGWWRRQK